MKNTVFGGVALQDRQALINTPVPAENLSKEARAFWDARIAASAGAGRFHRADEARLNRLCRMYAALQCIGRTISTGGLTYAERVRFQGARDAQLKRFETLQQSLLG